MPNSNVIPAKAGIILKSPHRHSRSSHLRMDSGLRRNDTERVESAVAA